MTSRKFTVLLIMLSFCGLIVTELFAAQAGQILLNGRVKSFDLVANTVVVTDYDGKSVTLSIENETMLSKLKDGRIKVGDDVNAKYIIKDGKNLAVSFRKLAGC